jgi:hypothetical protein
VLSDIVPLVRVKVLVVVKFAPSARSNVALSTVMAVDTDSFDVVTVPLPEFESKIAVSLKVGTDAPPAPPDVVDQNAELALSHVPVPPTQNLFAITLPQE